MVLIGPKSDTQGVSSRHSTRGRRKVTPTKHRWYSTRSHQPLANSGRDVGLPPEPRFATLVSPTLNTIILLSPRQVRSLHKVYQRGGIYSFRVGRLQAIALALARTDLASSQRVTATLLLFMSGPVSCYSPECSLNSWLLGRPAHYKCWVVPSVQMGKNAPERPHLR